MPSVPRVATDFAQSVEKELKGLKMAGTRFKVRFSQPPCDKSASPWLCVNDRLLSATGVDQATFMIAPNVGETLKPLSATASGGELSRVVLALKAILAASDSVGTIIFDEVDAGIGGSQAAALGRKLKRLADGGQILVVTHLPQVASLANHHIRISKVTDGKATRTGAHVLDAEERIDELARMLGGVEITAKTREHAAEMLAGAPQKRA